MGNAVKVMRIATRDEAETLPADDGRLDQIIVFPFVFDRRDIAYGRMAA
jgi:hypothetical protein